MFGKSVLAVITGGMIMVGSCLASEPQMHAGEIMTTPHTVDVTLPFFDEKTAKAFAKNVNFGTLDESTAVNQVNSISVSNDMMKSSALIRNLFIASRGVNSAMASLQSALLQKQLEIVKSINLEDFHLPTGKTISDSMKITVLLMQSVYSSSIFGTTSKT